MADLTKLSLKTYVFDGDRALFPGWLRNVTSLLHVNDYGPVTAGVRGDDLTEAMDRKAYHLLRLSLGEAVQAVMRDAVENESGFALLAALSAEYAGANLSDYKRVGLCTWVVQRLVVEP